MAREIQPLPNNVRLFSLSCGGDIINGMATSNVKFTAIETVKKPATVKFKTKSGETVSFRAVKTFKKEEVVRFRAKKK